MLKKTFFTIVIAALIGHANCEEDVDFGEADIKYSYAGSVESPDKSLLVRVFDKKDDSKFRRFYQFKKKENNSESKFFEISEPLAFKWSGNSKYLLILQRAADSEIITIVKFEKDKLHFMPVELDDDNHKLFYMTESVWLGDSFISYFIGRSWNVENGCYDISAYKFEISPEKGTSKLIKKQKIPSDNYLLLSPGIGVLFAQMRNSQKDPSELMELNFYSGSPEPSWYSL